MSSSLVTSFLAKSIRKAICLVKGAYFKSDYYKKKINREIKEGNATMEGKSNKKKHL